MVEYLLRAFVVVVVIATFLLATFGPLVCVLLREERWRSIGANAFRAAVSVTILWAAIAVVAGLLWLAEQPAFRNEYTCRDTYRGDVKVVVCE